MQRKYSLLPVLLLAATLVQCSAKAPIIRDTVPVQRPEIDVLEKRTALIRTAECDIAVTPLSADQWMSFQEKDAFRLKTYYSPIPLPPCEAYFIILANTMEQPLADVTISRTAGQSTEQAFTAETLAEKYPGVQKSDEAYARLLSVHRLLSFEYELKKVDLDDDTLLYPFPFILPLDRVCFITVLPAVPKDIRNYTVSVSYSAGSVKKTVDFRFTRIEHRDEE